MLHPVLFDMTSVRLACKPGLAGQETLPMAVHVML